MDHWKEYINGLTARCQSPMVHEHLSSAIKLALFAKLDPSQCLDELVVVVLDGHRHSGDILYEMEEGFATLIAAGGRFPVERLFRARYTKRKRLEDEIQDYHIRGRLIDWLTPQCASYVDWKNVKAAHWKDLYDDGDAHNWFRYLKHCSNYLQSL